VSPSTNQFPPSSWIVYTHPKTNISFELPAGWWRRANAQFDLMAGPESETDVTLDLRTVSILHSYLQDVIDEDAERMRAKHRGLANRSAITSGIAMFHYDWAGATGSTGFIVRRTFFALDDRALVLTLRAACPVWQQRVAVFDHLLRTMLVLPRSQRADDPFAPTYMKSASPGYDPRADMIEFVR
jgi:hypothetical protein